MDDERDDYADPDPPPSTPPSRCMAHIVIPLLGLTFICLVVVAIIAVGHGWDAMFPTKENR
jgi:hypothetical protein